MVLRIAILLAILFLNTNTTFAEEPEKIEASPNSAWDAGSLEAREDEDSPWWQDALLWIPNRVLDVIDIFKLDVGIGPTVGGVVRVSKYAQAGFRPVAPVSVRAGLFGRDLPVLLETSSEIGISPAFKGSSDRTICPGEVGVGIDIVAGVYGGICVDEVVDFLGGLVFLDPKGDDLEY